MFVFAFLKLLHEQRLHRCTNSVSSYREGKVHICFWRGDELSATSPRRPRQRGELSRPLAELIYSCAKDSKSTIIKGLIGLLQRGGKRKKRKKRKMRHSPFLSQKPKKNLILWEKAGGVRGSGAQEILVRNECPLEGCAKRKKEKRKNMRSIPCSKASPVYSETNVRGPETGRWLVRLHPWEEKMGLLMLLLVVMAASSHLRGTTERSPVTSKSHPVQNVRRSGLLVQHAAYWDTKIKSYRHQTAHSGLMLVEVQHMCWNQKRCQIFREDESSQGK